MGALWVESMNTVLDDNKKLCITSEEIIALSPQVRMVFEVEDLTAASPATASRWWVVYIESSDLGNKLLIESLDFFPEDIQRGVRRNAWAVDALIQPANAPRSPQRYGGASHQGGQQRLSVPRSAYGLLFSFIYIHLSEFFDLQVELFSSSLSHKISENKTII